jgi:hypothetical protein
MLQKNHIPDGRIRIKIRMFSSYVFPDKILPIHNNTSFISHEESNPI